MILFLALAMSAPIAREEAMERCAEAVVAKLHPRIGMADMTGTKFEWLQASTAGADWVIIGAITEPTRKGRVAHRFECVTHEPRQPRVRVLRTATLQP